jgi:hypothetical protein
LTPIFKSELVERLLNVRSAFLHKLQGKDYFIFEQTFSRNLVDILAILCPTSEQSLFENELLQHLPSLTQEYLKKYAFAFICECEHFLSSNVQAKKQVK